MEEAVDFIAPFCLQVSQARTVSLLPVEYCSGTPRADSDSDSGRDISRNREIDFALAVDKVLLPVAESYIPKNR